MSGFTDIFLNRESPKHSDVNSVKPKENLSNDDVIIKIRDQESVNNEYIRFFIEIYIKDTYSIWYDKVNEKSWSVYRRFREFEDLRKQLVKRYPASLIPPLPSKINSFNPMKMVNQKSDTEFIDCRRQRLEWFLRRLIDHPKLKNEELILHFLRDSSEWNWTEANGVKLPDKLNSVFAWRFLNIQSSLINLFDQQTQFQEIIKSNTMCDEAKALVDRGKELQKFTRSLIDELTKIESNTETLHLLYKNYGEAFYEWCGFEEKIGNCLQTYGHLCDTFANLVDTSNSSISNISTHSIILPSTQPTDTNNSNAEGSVTSKLRRNNTIEEPLSWMDIILLLQEYHDFGECWINLGGRLALLVRKLSRNQELSEDYKTQIDRLKTGQPQHQGMFHSIKSKLQKQPSDTDIQDNLKNLEEEFNKSESNLTNLQKFQELFIKSVDEELDHFERMYSRGMRLILYSYAHNKLAHSERCLRLWQRAKQSINDSG